MHKLAATLLALIAFTPAAHGSFFSLSPGIDYNFIATSVPAGATYNLGGFIDVDFSICPNSVNCPEPNHGLFWSISFLGKKGEGLATNSGGYVVLCTSSTCHPSPGSDFATFGLIPLLTSRVLVSSSLVGGGFPPEFIRSSGIFLSMDADLTPAPLPGAWACLLEAC